MGKYSLDEIRKFFKNEGYEVISNKYINNREKLEVICPNGHEWKVSLFDFKVRNVRCPYCHGNYNDKNKKLNEIRTLINDKFEIIEFKNTRDLTLKCLKCNEIFKVEWRKFKKHLTCPFCSGRRKTIKHIRKFVRKFNYELLSQTYTYEKKLKFKCPNGHTFEMKWNDFQQGHRCPICQKKYNYSYNEVKYLVENDKLGKFKLITNKNDFKNSKFEVKCLKCGNVFKTNIYKWLSGLRCFSCWLKSKTSKIENKIVEFLKENGIKNIIQHDREVLNGKEIDIYLPEFNFGIEVCGLLWHSFQMKPDKYYHQKKWKLAYSKNIKLLQIFEDEWYNHKDTLKSKILLTLGITNNFKKIRASKCEIEITDKIDTDIQEFLNNYHLQGYVKQFIFATKLIYKNELVGTMVFSKNRFSKNKNEIELIRLCFKPRYLIYGGTEKMFKHSLKYIKENIKNTNKIITFADLRYFTGKIEDNIYTKLGFKFEKITKPNYYYFRPEYTSIKYHRFTLKKKQDDPKDLTEFQLREKEGWYWIYDAGNLKYTMKIKNEYFK